MLLFLGGVATIYLNLSDGAKKYQQTFLALLSGMDSISILGDCAKKCQQLVQWVTLDLGELTWWVPIERVSELTVVCHIL